MAQKLNSQQEIDQINEYDRRLRAGLNPSPLIKKIPLEEIAGLRNVDRVSAFEKIDQTSVSRVRDSELRFLTTTKRLLWQAYGQEHIEPELLDFMDQIPKDKTYFDVGASNGVFALYAASRGIKVVCFEAEIENFALLNHNTYLNHHIFKHPVSNFNIALSDSLGLGHIYIEKFEPGGHLKILDSNTKRGNKSFSSEYRQAVLKFTLDEFLKVTNIATPNYMKIDVDGSERQVLKGMIQTLKNSALQKIFIELEEQGENFSACNAILEEYGFYIESRKRVQNYFGEENIVYARRKDG